MGKSRPLHHVHYSYTWHRSSGHHPCTFFLPIDRNISRISQTFRNFRYFETGKNNLIPVIYSTRKLDIILLQVEYIRRAGGQAGRHMLDSCTNVLADDMGHESYRI